VAETGLMLSADSDCIGQRAVAPGQRILWIFAFFLWEYYEGKDLFRRISFTISSETHASQPAW
jgi:hypothetical protein